MLNEQSTGLHVADLEQLRGLVDHLVDPGKFVIVIEHLAVMAHADWIIDLGKGAASRWGPDRRRRHTDGSGHGAFDADGRTSGAGEVGA